MGTGIARIVREKAGLDLVGAYSKRRGGDLGDFIAETRPEIAIQATCSTLIDAKDEIVLLVRNGVHVISIAEEMAWPACRSEAFAEEIHALAVEHGVGVLGTGINPGFVLDLLVIVLTGVCADVESITAKRVNDLSPYGPSVLDTQGVGLSPEQFAKGLEDGSVHGHFGFPESIHMIASTLGWEIERIEETRDPIISKVRRETPFVVVGPGQVAGCLHRATAFREGKPVITLIHPQQIHPQLEGVATGDSIEIKGAPDVRLAGSPEIAGGAGTCALAVNMIPKLMNASPGLHSMADLPAPGAILGDARGSGRFQPASSSRSRDEKRTRRLEATATESAMTEQIEAGVWVEIRRIELEAGERAPQVPADTSEVPLEMRVKGVLIESAAIGEEAEIETPSRRRLRGILAEVNPPYTHTFGAPIPELITVGSEARTTLRQQGGRP